MIKGWCDTLATMCSRRRNILGNCTRWSLSSRPDGESHSARLHVGRPLGTTAVLYPALMVLYTVLMQAGGIVDMKVSIVSGLDESV